MQAVSTSTARRHLADLINRAAYAGERTLIERRGRPVAALVTVDDIEAMQALEDAMDIRAADDALRDAEEHGGTMDFEAFLKTLD